KLTPDAGADVVALVKGRAMFVAEEAIKAKGPEESQAAYEADALVALVTGDVRLDTFQGLTGGRRRSPGVVYHVNVESIRRGRLEPGEVCEVPGVGVVPLAVLEDVVGDATAKLVIKDGVDVRTVCHIGRTVPAAVETALEARDPVCVIPGCDVAVSLEIDHWKIPFAKGGPTVIWNLARICRFHHQMKTYEGYELRGGPGQWEWIAPAAPDEGLAAGP
ncbi:MAG: HNH endonuclease, partial [Acidobacteriota bacterium]|nr:HNH endonuclease [Acidobacteriota bacterium]